MCTCGFCESHGFTGLIHDADRAASVQRASRSSPQIDGLGIAGTETAFLLHGQKRPSEPRRSSEAPLPGRLGRVIHAVKDHPPIQMQCRPAHLIGLKPFQPEVLGRLVRVHACSERSARKLCFINRSHAAARSQRGLSGEQRRPAPVLGQRNSWLPHCL